MICNATSPGSPSIEPLWLALNAAEGRLQLVLGDAQGTVLHGQEYDAPGRAMPLLAPALAHAFSTLGLNLPALKQRLAGIACVRGPGNFTGLRLSLSTALGLGRALDVPLAGVEYLPLLAAGPISFFPEHSWQSTWVATHARQGEVYLQGFTSFDEAADSPAPLAPPVVLPVAQAAKLLHESPGPCALLGGGIRRHHEAFLPCLQRHDVHLMPPFWDQPHLPLLLRHALLAQYDEQAVAPLYLRVSDAEENLAQIARKQGQDPDSMRQELSRLTQGDGSPGNES